MFVQSLQPDCFHQVKNPGIFCQMVETHVSHTISAADRLWYLLKDTWSQVYPSEHTSQMGPIDITTKKSTKFRDWSYQVQSGPDMFRDEKDSKELLWPFRTSFFDKSWPRVKNDSSFKAMPICKFVSGFSVFSVLQLRKNNRFCTATSTVYTRDRQHATVLGTPSMPDDAGKVPLKQKVGQFAPQVHSVPVLCLFMYVFYFEAELEWSWMEFPFFSEWQPFQPEVVSFLISLNSVWSMSRDMPWWQELTRVQCVERVHNALNITVYNGPQ